MLAEEAGAALIGQPCGNVKSPAVVAPPATPPQCDATPAVTVQCRGIDLLGFVFGGSVVVCVHQLAVELWKRYDTPRVSVQKKITEMHLQLNNCTREQIHALRKAGIIGNFRATNLPLQDAELLCDALDFSRRKRGLEKHPLKSTSANRHLRREEMRAKKLIFRRVSGVQRQPTPTMTSDIGPRSNAQGALNRDVNSRSAEERGSASSARVNVLQGCSQGRESSVGAEKYPSTGLGTLLVVEDAFELLGYEDWEFSTELAANGSLADSRNNSIESSVPQRMDEDCHNQPVSTGSMHKPLDVQEYWYVKRSMQSARASDSLSSSLGCSSRLCPPTTLTLHCPVPRIRSPSFCSSGELEEQSPRHFSRSHSAATTPVKSSPDRFLFIDSENSDFEAAANNNQNNFSTLLPHCHRYRGIPHKGKQLRETGGSASSSADLKEQRASSNSSVEEGGSTESTDISHSCVTWPLSGPKQHRSVKATKLCHYAKTTSPSTVNTTCQGSKSKHKSLVVSISLSSLSPTPTVSFNKQRKPTALSNFATKKRALSRSPSVASNQSTPVSSSLPVAVPNGNEMGGKQKKDVAATRGGRVKRPPTKGAKPRGRPRLSTTVRCKHQNMDVQQPPPPLDGTELSGISGRVEPPLLEHGLEVPPNVVEDDQVSIASSNTTTSSANSVVVSNKKTIKKRGSGKKQTRGGHNMLRIDSNFSLQSLFSYCPPTLTVKNGELVPEQSLSIRNLDRSSLPSAHPIDRWSLGQPVRGRWAAAGPKVKRPRKNTSNNSKL